MKKQKKALKKTKKISQIKAKMHKMAIYTIGALILLNFTFFTIYAKATSKIDEIANNSQNTLNSDNIEIKDIIDFGENILSNRLIESIDLENDTIYDKISENNRKIDENLLKSGLTHNNSDLAMKVAWSGYYEMTAYNSVPGQTDDTPCITANGFNVCEHNVEDTVAANFLKFNTKIRIPELFGNRIFVVRDRMNKRYPSRVDVWMKNYSDARRFGHRVAKIEILE